MTFNSYQFILLFLPIALIGSYVCIHFKRNWKKWLLAISLVFYACNGVKYLPFIIVNIVVNYLFYKQIISKKIKAKSILRLAVFCNVIVLIIFKYLNFTKLATISTSGNKVAWLKPKLSSCCNI